MSMGAMLDMMQRMMGQQPGQGQGQKPGKGNGGESGGEGQGGASDSPNKDVAGDGKGKTEERRIGKKEDQPTGFTKSRRAARNSCPEE